MTPISHEIEEYGLTHFDVQDGTEDSRKDSKLTVTCNIQGHQSDSGHKIHVYSHLSLPKEFIF